MAEIYPEYGGMISQLRINDTEILSFNGAALKHSPAAAGGIPILFPFSGQIKNSEYEDDGVIYHMEKHGFIKDQEFKVAKYLTDQITLAYKPDEDHLKKSYPYSFLMEVTYRLTENSLDIWAQIQNHAARPMPHTLGWHPYFRVSDLTQVKMEHHMKTKYDYINVCDLTAPQIVDLNQFLDNVYCHPRQNDFSLTNYGDGYEVHCRTGEEYQALVVYTGAEGSVCIEPWCGLPDSIHNNRLLQWIPANEKREYRLKFFLSTLEKV